MINLKVIFLLSIYLLFNNVGKSQNISKFEIVASKNGKFSLVEKETRETINNYRNCEVIDSIKSLNFPTNKNYQNYLFIQKGKSFFLYDFNNGKEIISFELNSKFSASIFEVRTEPNELAQIRIDENIISNYINILLEEKNLSHSILFNLTTQKIIVAHSSYYATFFYLINNDLIVGQSFHESFVVNSNGKTIVPPTTNIYLNYFFGGFAVKVFKYGVINFEGDTIAPFIYENAEALAKNSFVILENSERKAGVINKHGKILVPFIYRPKHPNFFRNYSYSKYGVFMFYKTNYHDSNFVFVDTLGTELIKEATYQNAWELRVPNESNFNSRYYFVENGKTGIYDTKQKKEIIPCKFEFYNDLSETKFGVISAKDEKGNWGLINLETGQTIIPFSYEGIKSKFIYTQDGTATFILCKQGKYGLIDCFGTTQLPCTYSNIKKTKYENFVIVEMNGLYGLFDIKNAHFVIPVELQLIDKNLSVEKVVDDQLRKGKYEVKSNSIKWF